MLLRKELLLADCDGPVAMPESPEPPLADDDEPLTVAELDAEVESAPGDGDLGAVSLLAGATPGAATSAPVEEGTARGEAALPTGAVEPRCLASCIVRTACAPVLEDSAACEASEPL